MSKLKKIRFSALLLTMAVLLMAPAAYGACVEAGPTEWWDNDYSDRVEVTLTEPGTADRVNSPTQVGLEFSSDRPPLNSVRMTCFDGSSWTELPSQWSELDLTSGGKVKTGNMHWLADVDESDTAYYYVYHDETDLGAPGYSTSWGSVSDDGEYVTLQNDDLRTVWSYDNADEYTRGVSIYDKVLDFEWLKPYVDGQGIPHSGWNTRIDDTSGNKFKVFKEDGLLVSSEDGPVFKEAVIRTTPMTHGSKKLRAYYTVRLYKDQREFKRVLSIEGRTANNFIEDAVSRIAISLPGNGGEVADAYVWEGDEVGFDDDDGVEENHVADSDISSNFFGVYGNNTGEGSFGLVWESATDDEDIYRVEFDSEYELDEDERNRLEANELEGVNIELDKGDFWHHDGVWVVLGEYGNVDTQEARADELANPLTVSVN